MSADRLLAQSANPKPSMRFRGRLRALKAASGANGCFSAVHGWPVATQADTALEVLSQSEDDRARALAGRLWLVNKHDATAASKSFRAIESQAISLHPQVVIERDKALAALGSETIDERRPWLNAVSALDDEWLVSVAPVHSFSEERYLDLLKRMGLSTRRL